MKRDRWLHLVPPAPPEGGDDEPPFTDQELREAAALREALERGSDTLAGSLRAAWEPEAIDATDLDAIVGRTLGDGAVEAPHTRAELRAAQELREDLARGGGHRDESALFHDLRSAYRPAAIAPSVNEALIAAALRRSAPRVASRFRGISPATMAALSGVAALAAGIALLVGRADLLAPPSLPPESAAKAPSAVAAAPTLAAATLIRARSTQELFDPASKFPVAGDESARVDRIVAARTADLRANRFASWGVR